MFRYTPWRSRMAREIFNHSREVKISLKQQIYFQMKLMLQKCASIRW
jgi:hypothetical protein